MANIIYSRFKANLLNGECDLEADTIKVALMATGHSASSATGTAWASVSANEITGTGYTTKGATLADGAVTEAATTKFDGTDTAWANASFSAYYAVLFDDTLVNGDLICSFDFGGAKTVSAGTFTIVWHTDGILTLA